MGIKNSKLAEYLAQQIFQEKLPYDDVVKKYPRYQSVIDTTLNQLNLIPFENQTEGGEQ